CVGIAGVSAKPALAGCPTGHPEPCSSREPNDTLVTTIDQVALSILSARGAPLVPAALARHTLLRSPPASSLRDPSGSQGTRASVSLGSCVIRPPHADGYPPQPTWMAGRRRGSGSACRNTSCVSGAMSPSPNRM